MTRTVPSVLSRFTFKRIIKGGLGMGFVYGLVTLSQSAGLLRAYPDLHERLAVIGTLKASSALQVLYGPSNGLDGGVHSFVTWRVMGTLIQIAAIWAIVVTTRLLRGDEESGRQEYVLANPITPLWSMLIVLRTILLVIVAQVLQMSLMMYMTNRVADTHFSIGDGLLYGVTVGFGALLFVGISALSSQLFETRRAAALSSAGVLIVMFLLRAGASVSVDLSWMKYLSPLSWLDSAQPLTGKQYAWYVPVVFLVAVCIAIALFMIQKRDLQHAPIKPKDTKLKKTALVQKGLPTAFLFLRSSMAVWGAVIVGLSVFMSSLSKTVSVVIEDSSKFQDTVSAITGASTNTAVKLFLGLSMFISIILMGIASIGAVGTLRSDESSGRLDMIFSRSASRLGWLFQRLTVISLFVLTISLISGLAAWMVTPGSAHVSFSTMLLAGLNIVFPAYVLIGICVCMFGHAPRLTTAFAYGVVGWSFLVEIIIPLFWPSSKLMNLSLYHHVALVPASDFDVRKSLILLGVGVGLTALGALRFRSRDLVGE